MDLAGDGGLSQILKVGGMLTPGFIPEGFTKQDHRQKAYLYVGLPRLVIAYV